MLRTFGAWLIATVVAYSAAAIAATQSVMTRLAEMNVPVGIGDRLRTTGQDLIGMAPMFAPMIAGGFAIAFVIAALIVRKRPDWQWFGYPLAGGVAVLVIHLALQVTFHITPVAAARSAVGLAIQVLCGILGGWVFLRLHAAIR